MTSVSGESTWQEEDRKGKVRRGGWQTRVVSVNSEMECQTDGVFADVGRNHPRTNREGLGRLVPGQRNHTKRATIPLASGMAPPSLPKLLPNANPVQADLTHAMVVFGVTR